MTATSQAQDRPQGSQPNLLQAPVSALLTAMPKAQNSCQDICVALRTSEHTLLYTSKRGSACEGRTQLCRSMCSKAQGTCGQVNLKVKPWEGLLDWRCLEVNANLEVYMEVKMYESRFRVHD